jgi:putative ABC transport system permease protein
MKFLPLVFRNLLRNRRRTILTVLSIAVSVFIFAALMSLPGLVEVMLRDRVNSLRLICASKAGFLSPLPEAYRRRIAALPHVEAVVGVSIFIGTYRDPKDAIPCFAVDADETETVWPDWGITPAAAAQFRASRRAALVEGTLMRRFGWHIGDNLVLRGTLYPVDLELSIVGTLGGSAPPSRIMFRRDLLDEALGHPGTVNILWVKLDRADETARVIAAIDSTFANSAVETRTESEENFARAQISSFRLLFDGARVLAAIVVFAIVLVAANTAAMSVRERRHELAVMRAIGFERRTLIACLVAEGLLIGIVGGLAGCAGAWVALRMLPYASRTLGMLALMISLPGRVVVESFVTAALIGLGSSLAPATAATRGDISAALRAIV